MRYMKGNLVQIFKFYYIHRTKLMFSAKAMANVVFPDQADLAIDSCFGVHYQVLMRAGSLESTKEA